MKRKEVQPMNIDLLVNNTKSFNRFKLLEGSNIYRIMPPVGEDSRGIPFKRWDVVWGLYDPEVNRVRPVASLTTSKYDAVCPVKTYLDMLKAKLEKIKDKDSDVANYINSVIFKNISVRRSFFYNAVSKDFKLGLLELRPTAHKALLQEMRKFFEEYQEDPTALVPNQDCGVWFDIIKTGSFRDTTYYVKRANIKIKQDKKILFEDDRTPIPEQLINEYPDSAYNLNNLYVEKSFDELVDMLVLTLNSLQDAPPEVLFTREQIIAATELVKKNKKSNKTTASDDADDSDNDDSLVVVSTKPTHKTSSVREQVQLSSSEDEDELDLLLKSRNVK